MGDPIIYIGIAFTLLAAGALIGYGMAILQVIHQLENEIEALQDEIKKIMKEIRDDESGSNDFLLRKGAEHGQSDRRADGPV